MLANNSQVYLNYCSERSRSSTKSKIKVLVGEGSSIVCTPELLTPEIKKINMKYEEAIKELETIVSQIEKNELDIDQLTDRLKEAQKLIKLCKDKLYKTDEKIKAMLAEE